MKAWFWAMTVGSFTTCTGTKATSAFPSSQEYSSADPRANVVIDTPLNRRLASLVTLPARWRSMSPSVNISEWIP